MVYVSVLLNYFLIKYTILEITTFAYETHFLWRATIQFQMSLTVWKYFQFFWIEISPYIAVAHYINFYYSVYKVPE